MNEEDACNQCGSTDFTLEDDGRTYCANGHDQERGIATAEDDADFGRQGRLFKKKDIKSKTRISKVLRGAKAHQLYLQAWQLILWKQCYILVHQKALPPELWTVVRNLWILWLDKLEARLHDPLASFSGPDQEANQDSDSDPHATSGAETDNEEHPTVAKKDYPGPTLIDTVVLIYLSTLLLRQFLPLQTLHAWLTNSTIPYIRAIRHIPHDMRSRLPSEYHHSFDPLGIPSPDTLQLAVYRRSKMFHTYFGMETPSLNQNLLLMHYIREMALPIEVYSMARQLGRILGFTLSYHDDEENRRNVKGHPRRAATSYPEAQAISMTIVATKILFPFKPASENRHDISATTSNTMFQMNWDAWQDAKTTFDTAMHQLETINGTRLKPGSEINVTEQDVLTMTGDQLDQYMDWFQQTWTEQTASTVGAEGDQSGPNNNRQDSFRSQTSEQENVNSVDQTILNLFPLEDLDSTRKTDHASQQEQDSRLETQRTALLDQRIMEVQSSLHPLHLPPPAVAATTSNPNLSRESAHMSNESMPRPEIHQTFYAEAARIACLSEAALERAIVRTEDLVEKWRKEKIREEVMGRADELDEHEQLDTEQQAPGSET
ncbi:hypothetical protein B0A52_00222 [Exophiala mesophila]|uniref:Uncharacterized protein n=1 Tax=Exophiala mesophila TaxID=212818 RepID=A0A438NJG3_EXOME|nr:hypothetical protein B0A52_00222 [Exophiala mesophila]